MMSSHELRHRHGFEAEVDRGTTEEEKPKYDRNPRTSPSALKTLLVGGVLVYIAAIALVLLVRNLLPTPLPVTASSSEFAEDRARIDLNYLANTGIGRRLVGTKYNEEKTVSFILKRINEIRKEPCAKGGECARLALQVQNATGSFPFWFIDRFIHNTYTNITNIAVEVRVLVCLGRCR
jgi:hypothetical protein